MLRQITNNPPSHRVTKENSPKGNINLKNGEIIKATVISKLKGGDFLISSQGKQIKAFSPLPLVDGGKYLFKVITGDKGIELRIVRGSLGHSSNSMGMPASGNMISFGLTKILSHLTRMDMLTGLSIESAGILNKIKSFLNPHFLNDHKSNISWVNKSIQGSGIFWENKLLQYLMGKKEILIRKLIDSDLKGLLLSLKNCIGRKDTHHEEFETITVKLKEALNLIEREQLLNLASIREEHGWLIHLAGLKEEGFENVDLYVKKKSNKKGLFFSIYMELTKLGKMELNVAIVDSQIDIRIFVGSERISKYIADQLPELENGLTNSGLKSGQIVCDVKDFDEGFEPEEKGSYSSVHVVI